MKDNMTKIMLVEDDKSLREIYGVRLLAEGYDIVSAGDGEEALAMAIKNRPALIVSDVMMPKISGFDMLDILRSTTETKNIRVIMMTALSSEEQRQRGEQLGADKYLVKSQVGIEDVVKAVHEVLGDQPTGINAAPPAAPTAAPLPAAPLAAMPPPVESPAPSQPVSTIPEPTAPFTGERPAGLGERIIQPLKDNPRVETVDVGELMNNELAHNVQAIEDAPVAPAVDPVTSAPAADPVQAPPVAPPPQAPSVSAPPADQFAAASAPAPDPTTTSPQASPFPFATANSSADDQQAGSQPEPPAAPITPPQRPN